MLILIWSKNRACQLHLLLESIYKNLHPIHHVRPYVIYDFDEEEFGVGYNKVINAFKDVTFFAQGQTSFRKNTLDAIELANNSICFMKDSNVIYREVECEIPSLYYNECFSLRLGFNTLVQNYRNNEQQSPLTSCFHRHHYVFWNASLYHPASNYGYTMSLDGHCYMTKHIKSIIENLKFHDTNSLETELGKYRNEMLYMSSYEKSVLVDIVEVNETECNNQYINGNIIDISSVTKENILGTHQKINLEYKTG